MIAQLMLDRGGIVWLWAFFFVFITLALATGTVDNEAEWSNGADVPLSGSMVRCRFDCGQSKMTHDIQVVLSPSEKLGTHENGHETNNSTV